jgi:hypothetical protein
MNPALSEAKLKCVTVMVFEKNGKTILQPIIRGQDTQNLHELFQKNTLEVWLPNGRPDFEQFDVGILKYKQIVQPSKVCSKVKNRECLKNHFETIVSCEQCPLSNEGSQIRKRKEHTQLPNISLQVRRLGRCST